MVRVSLAEMSTRRWSFEEDLTHYRDEGIRSIGVWRRKLLDFGEEKGAELIRDAGLSVSSLCEVGGFTGDCGSLRDAVVEATDALHLAASLGAHSLVLVTGSRNNHTNKHVRSLVRSALQRLAPIAAELDVQLALHPMCRAGSARWSFIDGIQGALEIVGEMGHSHIGLGFELSQLRTERVHLEQLSDWCSLIKLVTINDIDLRHHTSGPNDGSNWRHANNITCDLVTRLESAGFAGFYELQLAGENYWKHDPQHLLENCHRWSDHFAQHLVQCASASRGT